DGAPRAVSRLQRFATYGALGWCAEVVYTGVLGYLGNRDRRLMAWTSLWMFPVYGLIQPLDPPLHRAMRARVLRPLRALAPGGGPAGRTGLSVSRTAASSPRRRSSGRSPLPADALRRAQRLRQGGRLSEPKMFIRTQTDQVAIPGDHEIGLTFDSSGDDVVII